MGLGKRLRQARMEQGLSQRQLCGDVITRNMLSLIENGSALPSLDTLTYLAQRLQRPVSYFLDEASLYSDNTRVMEQARAAYAARQWGRVLELLQSYRNPDGLFDAEKFLLETLSATELAEAAIEKGKEPYALELLQRAEAAGMRTPYDTPELRRRRLLAKGQLMTVDLPVDDRELLLRSRDALAAGAYLRGAQYLDAAEDRDRPQWHLLRGKAFMAAKDYQNAADCYKKAWSQDPRGCAAALEVCHRELGDYQSAYHYACLLREMDQKAQEG